jgi:two-component sensor histidine kinase
MVAPTDLNNITYFRKVKLMLYLLGSILACTGIAQTPVLYNYQSGNGLPSNEVYNVLADKQGYTWFATDRGIARFDGSRFVTFPISRESGDNFVDRLILSPGGRLWIVASGRNLYQFDGKQFLPYFRNSALSAYINRHTNGWILQVGFKDEKPAAFVIRGLGLFQFNSREELERVHPEDGHRRLSYDTSFGLPYYSELYLPDRKKKKENHFYFRDKEYKATASQITCHLRRQDGSLLISFGNKIFEADKKVVQQVELDNMILNLYEDKAGRLWVCSYGHGIFVYPPHKNPSEAKPQVFFPDTRISGIAEDNEGGYWLSSNDKGVLYVPSIATQLTDEVFFTKGEHAQEIGTGDPNTLYVVTSLGRVFRSVNGDPLSFFQKAYPDKVSTVCNDIVYDSLRKIVYFSFSERVFAIQTTTHTTTTYPLASRTILPTEDLFYNLTPIGLMYDIYSPKTIKSLGVLGNFSAFRYSDGTVLTGSDMGLTRIRDKVATPFANHIIRQRVTSIKRLNEHVLVIATLGLGLALIRGDSVSLVPLGRSSSINMVNEIAVSNDTIWAATEGGVVRVFFSGDKPDIHLMDMDDRFLQNNTRRIAVAAGRVYVLAQNRLVSFPTGMDINRIAPPIFLNDILVGDTLQLDPKKSHRFQYTDRRFRFNFNGIAFKAGHLIRYRYRLLGLHNDWYTTAQPFVDYPSLQPGSYTFEVAAVNENGILSPQTATYNFTIPAPFWKKGWFIALLIGLLAITTWWLIRQRARAIQRKNREKELLLAKEQVALSAQINPHFIFNSLNSIQHLILQEDRKSAVLYMAQFSRLMRLSLDNSRKKWVTVSNETELLQLYLELERLRFKDKFLYHLQIQDSLKTGSLLIPAMLLQPFVENAIQHGVNNLSGSNGLITISLQMEGQQLMARIEDNGVGRAKANTLRNETNHVHQSAGMQITEERLRLLCKETRIPWTFAIVDKATETHGTTGTLVSFAMPYIITKQAQT